MNHPGLRTTASRRAGPLFGAVLVVGAIVTVLSPAAPIVRALDPTPSPVAADPAATASPDSGATPVPSDAAPAPSDTATVPPSDAPTPAPSDATSPVPSDTPSATPSDATSPAPSEAPSATPTPLPSGPVSVEHFWVSTLDQQGAMAEKGAIDKPLRDAARFTVYLVRFHLANVGARDVSITPRLDATDASGSFAHVPAVNPLIGQPFYAAADDGRAFEVHSNTIAATDLWLPSDRDQHGVATDGVTSGGRNPLPPMVLPAHTFTELEFAIRAGVDAKWLTTYQLRLDDDTIPISGSAMTVTMGAKPVVRLSPGAQPGQTVADEQTAVMRLAHFLTQSRAGAQPMLAGGVSPAAQNTSPHTNYTLTTDFCAACHIDHSADATFLKNVAAPSANLCFQCHDGLGATSDIQGQVTDPKLPANNSSTASYFSHPVMNDTGHISDRQDEFVGVLNRHSVCADCHQPHNATTTRPVETSNGWTAPGSIAGASSVSVTNGAAGSSPSFTFGSMTSLEYQLCFKCHSGYTTLPGPDPSHPSWWALDKAVELNPANVSYHPIEAAGKNQSDAIKLSLSGDAPGKLWSFTSTSTIRCTNCHGSPSAVSGGAATADSQIDNHASTNRGILLANYRDRVLMSGPDLYDPTNFSLCYLCHAEAPMVDDSGDARYDTNFNWHGFHLNDIWYKGTGGTSIDVAGDGQGNATCSECHFRTHGTALAANSQSPAIGLVNFAPDVKPYNGQIKFVPATPTTYGSCTLTCHGKVHNNFPYQYGYPVP